MRGEGGRKSERERVRGMEGGRKGDEGLRKDGRKKYGLCFKLNYNVHLCSTIYAHSHIIQRFLPGSPTPGSPTHNLPIFRLKVAFRFTQLYVCALHSLQ